MAFLRLQYALRSYLTTKSVDPIVVPQTSASCTALGGGAEAEWIRAGLD